MSERFEVPENDVLLTVGGPMVRASDVPGIVRAEVERALRKRQEDPLGFGIAAYLAARFPEAAPEGTHTCPNCGKHFLSKPGPRPGCLVLHPSGVCCHYGEVEATPPERREPTYPKAMTDRAEVPFLQGDRALLQRLDQFCTALAECIHNDDNLPVASHLGSRKTTNAARAYLEGK